MRQFQILFALVILSSFSVFSQEKPERKKVKISGIIIEKTSKQPLEYATITLINTKNPKAIFGGITNPKGEFLVEANAGNYDVKIEFISYKILEIKAKLLVEDTNLGIIELSEKNTELKEVVVRAETSTVEIKLDKKVYSVGKDMIVKGGTASDVLNNVPSVTVDSEGIVSLRGNENVKIFIDGRPSNVSNIATALQSISADAIDKVEVISNPSARYDAEGGAGILNIVLKKGKSDGLNGTIIATVGNPQNYGLQSTINYKKEKFNLFGGIGFVDAKSLGNSLTDSDYLNNDGSFQTTSNERSKRENFRKGHNFNFGIDLNISNSATWTNGINYRKNNGAEPNTVLQNYILPTETYTRYRFTNQNNNSNNVEYNSNFIKKFKKDGHKFTANFSASIDVDNDASPITTYIIGQEANAFYENSRNFQTQSKYLLQSDYVLPIKKSGQLEIGFKADRNQNISDYTAGNNDDFGNFIPNYNLTNVFKYTENITAGYTQYGSKFKKISYLIGLRFEDSKIDSKLLNTNQNNSRNYQTLFPSAFLTYPVSETTTIAVNYSRRIQRPRNRFINPFAGISSDLNIFQGNPDINPTTTDALDFSFLTKIKKVALSTSIYYNRSKNPFQFVRRPKGNFVNNTAVLISTPINLDSDDRFGIELTANLSPYKWWKLNSNFNFFQSQVRGDLTYTLDNTTTPETKNLDKLATGWFVKLNSKISLPLKIDWQTNAIYTAPQNTAQGQSLGVYNVNLAFSKDVFKDKATVSLNVSDLFNTNKMIRQFNLPIVNSYSEMQRRERQINLSFTYRFNKKKSDEKPKRQEEGGGSDF
jgi:outer membrane receptor for ferrienterochelin and colicins